MGKPLVIVDSEIKAATLGAQYEGDIDTLTVLSQPLRISLKPSKGKQDKDESPFQFTPAPEAKPFIDALLKWCDRDIYLGFDYDQGGEYLSWAISEHLKSVTKGGNIPRRLHLLGMGADELRESFMFVKFVDAKKASTYYMRSLFNSYLIKHVTRLLGTSLGPADLPLSHNSLTTLMLLAERDMEIQSYKPALKWEIKVVLSGPDGRFDARLAEAYEISDDGFLNDPAEGRKVVDMFKDKPFKVEKVVRKHEAVSPPAPYRMIELIHDAYLLFGISPLKTMDAAIRMFSGIKFKGSFAGLISTIVPLENTSMSTLAEKTKKYVINDLGVEAEEGKVEFDSSMIFPLIPEVTPEDLSDALDKDERNLYGLIRNRAIAGMMRGPDVENIEVELRAGTGCLFRKSMRSVKSQGFLAIYQRCDDRDLMEPCPLANLEQGMTVENLQIVPEQSSAFPPEYYTMETLFTDLADFSISVDRSSVSMAQSMLDRGYITITQEGDLRCNDNVIKVVSAINRAFPSMTGLNFSAYFEQTVSEAETGRKPLDIALKQFDQALMMHGTVLVKTKVPTNITLRHRKRSSSIIKTYAVPESEKNPLKEVAYAAPSCMEEIPDPEAVEPEDESPVSEDAGISEVVESEEVDVSESVEPEVSESVPNSVPEQKETPAEEPFPKPEPEPEPEDEEIAETPAEEARDVFDHPSGEPAPDVGSGADPLGKLVKIDKQVPKKDCPLCGRPMLMKKDEYGKFWSCSGFPACRHAESYQGKKGLEMICPLCNEKHVISKRTPTGRTFYVCPDQKCEFMAWSKPHIQPCKVCNSPFLVEKRTVTGKTVLRCPRAGCNYMEPMPGDDDMDLVDARIQDDPEFVDTPIKDIGSPVEAAPAPKKKKIRVRRSSKGSSSVSSSGKKKVRIVRRK
ncbi:MAG: DNA topoisomerase [Thermodesulfobacteriota bacterium]|nr:DNA topoisomerase [Thermodesulfobacteriota bacterium]